MKFYKTMINSKLTKTTHKVSSDKYIETLSAIIATNIVKGIKVFNKNASLIKMGRKLDLKLLKFSMFRIFLNINSSSH